jgi:hypothetical protein
VTILHKMSRPQTTWGLDVSTVTFPSEKLPKERIKKACQNRWSGKWM